MFRIIAAAFLAGIFLLPGHPVLAAAPSATLTTRLLRSGRNLSVSLVPDSSTGGCAYALHGSARLSDFDNNSLGGRLLVNFPAAAATTKRSATNLQFVRQSRKKAYFRARLSCGAETSLSNVATLNLKSGTTRTLNVSRWIRQAGTALSSLSITLTPAFPNLSFSSPLGLISPGDGTSRLFTVEQGGRIYVFGNRSTANALARSRRTPPTVCACWRKSCCSNSGTPTANLEWTSTNCAPSWDCRRSNRSTARDSTGYACRCPACRA